MTGKVIAKTGSVKKGLLVACVFGEETSRSNSHMLAHVHSKKFFEKLGLSCLVRRSTLERSQTSFISSHRIRNEVTRLLQFTRLLLRQVHLAQPAIDCSGHYSQKLQRCPWLVFLLANSHAERHGIHISIVIQFDHWTSMPSTIAVYCRTSVAIRLRHLRKPCNCLKSTYSNVPPGKI
jgi:hypothetical protein